MPPVHYLPHELSPILKVLGDRVVEVVGMSSDTPSRRCPALDLPDVQVALMKTAGGAVLRLAVIFQMPMPPGSHTHWYHLRGTRGYVESPRAGFDRFRTWIDGEQMQDAAQVDWATSPLGGPAAARASGHGGLDYYPHAHFRDAILHGTPPDIDVYQAVETAAPAILAADSADAGSVPMRVPDFRPGPERAAGEGPKGA